MLLSPRVGWQMRAMGTRPAMRDGQAVFDVRAGHGAECDGERMRQVVYPQTA